MSMPAPDSSFVEELVSDVDAYLHRLTVLTDFAESQVQERVRLTRAVEQLAADREAHLQTIATLDQRLSSLEGSVAVRVALAPRRIWRKVRRSPA
jgi:hypothetical protein